MLKGQKASINGTELFLCPFEKFTITQLSDTGSHMGTKALDVNSGVSGVEAYYYAPATVKCVWSYGGYEQIWQTVNPVRLANGAVTKVSFMCNHDKIPHRIGDVIKQGELLGQMSELGPATGVHCHLEVAYGEIFNVVKNPYGIYSLSNYDNEIYVSDACFMDNTQILDSHQVDWKYAKNLYCGNPVERDSSKEQVKVFTNKYYPTARKEPKVNGYLLGFVREGIYNILETKISDNRTWFRIDKDLWFDFGNEWCEILNKDNTEQLKQEIKNLRSKLEIAENENKKLKEQISKIKEILG